MVAQVGAHGGGVTDFHQLFLGHGLCAGSPRRLTPIPGEAASSGPRPEPVKSRLVPSPTAHRVTTRRSPEAGSESDGAHSKDDDFAFEIVEDLAAGGEPVKEVVGVVHIDGQDPL